MLKEIREIGQYAIEHQEQEQDPNLGDVNAGALSRSQLCSVSMAIELALITLRQIKRI